MYQQQKQRRLKLTRRWWLTTTTTPTPFNYTQTITTTTHMDVYSNNHTDHNSRSTNTSTKTNRFRNTTQEGYLTMIWCDRATWIHLTTGRQHISSKLHLVWLAAIYTQCTFSIVLFIIYFIKINVFPKTNILRHIIIIR